MTQHYKQVADIDLMNEEWTPIGRNEQIDGKYVGHFRGIFDGDLHELTNLKITKDLGINGYSGLFGQADDSNPHSSVLSELRNIIIRSGLITSKADKTGGVVASGNIVTNCINYVNINVENKYIGGIAGYIIGKLNKAIEISQCKNFGNIKGSDPIWHRDGGIGGIVGVANNFYIKNGQSEYLNICHINDCSNNGQISGHGYIGGIVGISQGEWYPNSRIDGKISNSTNTGNIIGSGKFVGGIAGIATHINDCENSGIISSSKIESYLVSGTGGIAGSAVSIQASINNGKILGENSDNSGGIAGIIYTKVSKACIGNSNNGDIFGETNTAGIVGLFQVPYEFSLNFMTECSSNLNVGNVYGRKTSNYGGDFGFVGGIVGFASHQVIIENCINKGDITGEVNSLPNSYNGTIVSGIAAFAGRKLKNSYCVGKIFNKDKRQTSCVNAIACRYSPHEENDISSYEWNYWKDHIDDDAQAGFSVAGDKIYSLMQFSASSWPQWPLSTTSWKSLGSWNNGSPTYPKLYFEE